MSETAKSTRLTVAIIVRDAGEALRATLNSVAAIADEIVVLDTGSADDTCQVAREFGARVFEHPWEDSFAAARNACWSHVQGDWVLWLDAGETLSGTDADQLRRIVQQQVDRATAYVLLVEVPGSAAEGAAERIGRIRLVPNDPRIRFSGRVRESLSEALAEHKFAVEGLPPVICRGARELDPRLKDERARRNVRLADLEIKEHGAQPHLLNCLGDAFQTLEDHDRAAQFFRHAIRESERGSIDMLEAYYGLLTSLDQDESNREQQLVIAVEANEVFPLDAQLLCAMGGYLQALGRTELAERSYQTAFRYGQIEPAVWHVVEVHQIAAICQSLALQLQDKFDDARAVLEVALTEYGESARVRRRLLELLVRFADRDGALAQIDELPDETPHREALRSAVRGACLASQQNWIPAKAYLKTAYQAGCRDPICLRWYSVALLAAGDADEAQRVLTEWQSAEPDNIEAARYLAALTSRQDPAPASDRSLRIDLGQSEESPNSLGAPRSHTGTRPHNRQDVESHDHGGTP